MPSLFLVHNLVFLPQSFIAQLKAEKNAKDRELMDLNEEMVLLKKSGCDPAAMQEEVAKALTQVLGPLKVQLTKIFNLLILNIVRQS